MTTLSSRAVDVQCTNERMRRFWAEFNEGRYMETRHVWNKEWSKDITEM